ncbi:probably inactive leucine-rich repeat receptor-like protein kinase At5g48380 [Abrus precatorius]|uniref:Probably inactive leucine-rich repeat receptor-like protein kinase At5g48380 n=1 Tax=Abrus precatorius TaxID=3816 RepID=A0A8B8L170_ABRPR|nr:probably inactive leucine-rich repeat receptor-like protein kinase At5g48380 [Abrus precatorius]
MESSNQFHESFRQGLIVGYLFSATFVIVFYMSYCLPSQLVKRRKSMTPQITKLLERLTSTLSLEELHDATDCFAIDNVIGMGKMGIMYEGRLPNGQLLAIKRPFYSQLFKRQFLSEIMVLSKYTHTNIVPLFGFCNEGKEKILVYQYMSNGRLSKWLDPLESEVVRLKWPQRFNIALGMARGLAWLHHCCDLHIVHLNLCSQCILLDDNFEPKISNFGEAKFMNPNTENDVGMVFKVSDGKKDVYDFGSVLFELITGKSYNELSLSSSIANLSGNPSNFYDAIDKSLIGEGFENQVCALLKVACECVQALPDQRPTMLEVYNNVSNMRKGQRGSSDDSDPPRRSEIVSITSRVEIIEL